MAGSNVAEAAEATSNTEAKTTPSSTPAASPAVAAPIAAPATTQAAAPAAEKKVEGKAAAPAAPVPIVFKDDKGAPFKGKLVEGFASMATDLGWTQEVADQHLGQMSQAWNQELSDAKAAMHAAWDAELSADKEIGGSKLAENRNLAKEAAESIGGADYLKWLDESGMAKNPQTVRFLVKVRQAISADKFVGGVKVVGRPGAITNPNDTSVAAFSKHYEKPATPAQ
jgi:hypothetical protein